LFCRAERFQITFEPVLNILKALDRNIVFIVDRDLNTCKAVVRVVDDRIDELKVPDALAVSP
jgi:hypothetical protein